MTIQPRLSGQNLQKQSSQSSGGYLRDALAPQRRPAHHAVAYAVESQPLPRCVP